ncbi:trimeric intracellular cation channel family protein [Catelliglobosispora koreensis]|uniref:trimeric intracellular cation channel family protein n=1 Tax=Catelliglobosispora koreensis TaxID=129052 RepID=UPI0003607525|nr:TRIC cation channel family protein [Catelliglobosispora koreensis]
MDSSAAALLAGDLTGVAVFAASGGALGVAKRLDWFGVVFVGFAAALGGGILRDLVIDKPPVAFYDWRYGTTALVASALVFWWHARLERMRRMMLLLDAAGLALFTVTATIKALEAGVPPMGACLIGMITGIGGGLVRDLLVGEIPVVLQRDIYALAALIGAVVVAILTRLEAVTLLNMIGAGVLIFVVRLTALYRRWSAPRAKPM